MELKIQQLFRNNEFDAAMAILEEKCIVAKEQISIGTGKIYLHLDYGLKATKDDVMTKECRGIALDMETWEVVRYGFYRFMNLGEGGCDILFEDNHPFEYEEKADGSIIILSYFDGRWVAGSRGVLFPHSELDNGLTLEQMFWIMAGYPCNSSVWDSVLDKNICYTFELCALANRIVIPYAKSQLVLLGARSQDDWKELKTSELDTVTENHLSKVMHGATGVSKFRRPEISYFDSIMDCVEATDKLHGFKEGFVIKRWNEVEGRYDRAKVKGRAYLDLHHVVCGLSLRNLTRMAVFGDRATLEEFDEYLEAYDAVYEKVSEFCSMVETEYAKACEAVKGVDEERERKKQFAMSLHAHPQGKKINGICFALFNGKADSVLQCIQNKSDRSGMRNLVAMLGLKQVVSDRWREGNDTDEDV